MLKKSILIILFLGTAGGAIGAYLYFKPARNFREATPDMMVMANDIIHDYTTDEISGNAKYLNKVIEVEGVVSDIAVDEKGFTNINLAVENEMAMVSCAMDPESKKGYEHITKGSVVKIKGQCSGMLMDIILVKSVLVQ